MAKKNAELLWKDIKLKIENSFNNCVYLNEKLKLFKQNDTIFSALNQKSIMRLELKDITKLDAVLVNSKLVNTKNSILLLSNQLSSELSNLAFLVGEKDPITIQETAFVATPIIDLKSLESFGDHVYIQQYDQQVDVLENELKVNIARTLPDISVGYVNQTLVGTHSVNGMDKSFALSDRFQSVQVGMQIPIFFGAAQKKGQMIKIDIDLKNIQKTNSINDLSVQFKQVLANYKSALSTYEMYENQMLKQIQVMKDQAKILVEAGEISVIEFLQTKQVCVDLEINYLETIKSMNAAVNQLNWFNSTKN